MGDTDRPSVRRDHRGNRKDDVPFSRNSRAYEENAKDDEIEAERIDRGDTKKRREKFLRPDRDTHGEKRRGKETRPATIKYQPLPRRSREDVTGSAREAPIYSPHDSIETVHTNAENEKEDDSTERKDVKMTTCTTTRTPSCPFRRHRFRNR